MPIAQRLKAFIDQRGIRYELVSHAETADSQHCAQAARVPGHQLAKAVLLEDEQGYVVAVAPACRHIHLGRLHRLLGRLIGLATEPELVELFPDCEPGAVPPLGTVYGLPTVVDEQLLRLPEVWFEAGDRCSLVRVSGEGFKSLLSEATSAGITEAP